MHQLHYFLYVIQVIHSILPCQYYILLTRFIGGNPYLQEDLQAGKSDQRIVVYFMSSEDANEYLNEIAQGTPYSYLLL